MVFPAFSVDKMPIRKNFDFTALFLTAALAAVGLVFIHSASSYSASLEHADAFFYVKKQAVAMALGLPLMVLVSFCPIDKIKNLWWLFLALSVALLAAVFIPGLGVESYGATRWLNLGFTTVQPSELAKFGLVIFIAEYMSEYGLKKFVHTLPVVGAGGVMCVLLMLEPNMSITICVAAVTAIMLFIGGIKGKHAAIYVLPVIAGVPALILAEPYRIRRILAFVDPWSAPKAEGYQLIQSFYALASGGFFGLGIGNSRQKYLFLPFAESDFILSIIAEETGFVGCLILLGLFVALIVHGIRTAARASTRFECYLAAGVTAMLAVQSAANVAVVSGAIPPTGLPLPFISAGGTSLIAYMCAVGLIMNVRRNAQNTQKLPPP